jgi:trimethylamine---corrinoid protein Co-methyltransferase
LAGISVDQGMLGIETIRAAGPGGNYLTADHTLQHFRQQVWQPALVNRDNPDTWAQKGGLRHEERVIQKTQRILETHTPRPVSGLIAGQLAEILSRAEQELAHVQFKA